MAEIKFFASGNEVKSYKYTKLTLLQIVYAGLMGEDKEAIPTINGVGKEGPVALKVSREHHMVDPNSWGNPNITRMWAYLAVQVGKLSFFYLSINK